MDNEVWAVDFSPEDRPILSGSIDGPARLWDIDTGAELRRFNNQTFAVYNAVFSPVGPTVLIGGSDGFERRFDVDYHERSVAESRDGRPSPGASCPI